MNQFQGFERIFFGGTLNLSFTKRYDSGDKIASMRMPTWIVVLASLLLLVVTAGIVYRMPFVYDRISWRVELLRTSLRTKIRPIQPLPTALPDPEIVSVEAVLPTPSPIPTKTPPPTAEFTSTPTASPTPLPGAVALPAPEW